MKTTVAVDLVLSAALGAVSLALVLMYLVFRRRQERQEELIQKLNAELTALKITGLIPDTDALDDLSEEPSEPVRRKGHLRLYLGGGSVAVILASLGERARTAWRTHRAPALVVTASVAAAGVASAAVLVAGTGTSGGEKPGPVPTATATTGGQSGSASPSPSRTGDPSHTEDQFTAGDLPPAPGTPIEHHQSPAPDAPHTSTPAEERPHGGLEGDIPGGAGATRGVEGIGGTGGPGSSTGNTGNTGGTGGTGGTGTGGSDGGGTGGSDGGGTGGPGGGEDKPPPSDDGLCLKVPRLLDLCLLGSN
ncbi:MAG TPA: hypothetical protein VK545_10150 [Streptomyces sp.]|nr:hypothetical protein [Streptomyces sp.]